MGQKTNPVGLRLGIIKSWESRWYSEKDYSKLLQEDINLRKFLMKSLSSAGISKNCNRKTSKTRKYYFAHLKTWSNNWEKKVQILRS